MLPTASKKTRTKAKAKAPRKPKPAIAPAIPASAPRIALLPTDVYIASADTFDAQAARRALVIVCNDDVLREQLRRDMRIEPLRTTDHYEHVASTRRAKLNGRVCAVVPNFNYGRFITEALDSLLAQTRRPDEIIVVDDASTDDSVQVVCKWMEKHPDVNLRLVRHDHNTGNVGGPRNTGIARTQAEFVICLDSDDLLEPGYIEALHDAIKDDHALGVVYSGVQTQEDVIDGRRLDWPNWPPQFDWTWQTTMHVQPRNCIPVASMFRREMWVRAGGYDAARISAEDVDFWVRGLATGFEARKVTDKPLFIYRRHSRESMSARAIERMDTWNPIYRGHAPIAAPTGKPPAQVMRDYTQPVISVVIPVGPGHAQYLPTAIHSILAQTFTAWELIVVDDTCGETLPLAAYPFARVVRPGASNAHGAGAARNEGMRAARGQLVFFLDADDFVLPRTLEMMAQRYAQGDAGYVYSGWWGITDAKDAKPRENIAGEWHPGAWMSYESRGLHGVSVLMAREDALKIGGFDESLIGLEDWEFFVKCTIAGLCGVRAGSGDALLGYRLHTGKRRATALKQRDEVVQFLKEYHGDYIEGRREIMGCCGGNGHAAQAIAQEMQMGRTVLPTFEGDGTVLMRYTGNLQGPVTYYGKYSGCVDCPPVYADNGDWQRLQETGVWSIVRPDMPFAPQPALPGIYIGPIYATDNDNERSR